MRGSLVVAWELELEGGREEGRLGHPLKKSNDPNRRVGEKNKKHTVDGKKKFPPPPVRWLNFLSSVFWTLPVGNEVREW